MERVLDLIISGLALLVFSPLFLPVAILLRLTGEGEVFFSQNRIGMHGQTFSLLKFATMLKDSPNLTGGTVTAGNDPRILPVGRFLRKTKINELPQLLNIFRGDMSLIGPRPLTRQGFDSYADRYQKIIVKVPPGLSGVGSIIFRNEEELLRNADEPMDYYASVILPYKGNLEEWYIDNRNIRLYLTAVFVTIWVVLFPSSSIAHRAFKGLPEIPENLKGVLY